MDAAKWSQQENDDEEIGLMMKPMEEIVSGRCAGGAGAAGVRGGVNNNISGMERKARPPEQLNCPRCNSTNTKFCYYNNYSLTQPRYFCKTCRRYWTEGGSLRNVPVGGGSRKNKRSSSTTFSSPQLLQQQQQPAAAAANSSHHHNAPAPPKLIPDLNPSTNSINNNLSRSLRDFSSSPDPLAADRFQKGQDLNLAFHPMQETHHQAAAMSQFLQINSKAENNNNKSATTSTTHHHVHHHHQDHTNSSSSPNYDHHHHSSHDQFSAMELLRTGMATRGFSSFLPGQVIDSNVALYNSSPTFSMHDYKPNLGFTIENGIGNRADHNNNNNNGGGGGRINFFPFGEMKQNINSGTNHDEVEHHHQGNKGNSSAGDHQYWSNNGVLGGGPW